MSNIKGGYSGQLGVERWRRMNEVRTALGIPHTVMVDETIDQAHRALNEIKRKHGGQLPELELKILLVEKEAA